MLFRLQTKSVPAPGAAWLRTNLGRATLQREELVAAVEGARPRRFRDWCDLEMRADPDGMGFSLEITLSEVGRFEAKAYFLGDGEDDPHWAEGDGNAVIHVAPAWTAGGANSIYAAFPRLFGRLAEAVPARRLEKATADLDAAGYYVAPPGGTLRDLGGELDLIIGQMRFGIVLLLPPFPVAVGAAGSGTYGSPFAPLDLFGIDPGLAQADTKVSALAQFDELVEAVHRRGARLFLDVPINHTGWGSRWQNLHPEWFVRGDDSEFVSPGAWGVVWPDLIKLDYSHRELWIEAAEVFLFWCERGADGFRCDAGHMIATEVWSYIIAKVRQQFPDTLFLLEGLGGEPEHCAQLLDRAGFDWDYSELFHRLTRSEIERDAADYLQRSSRTGLLVNFVETHDNDRVAKSGERFATMRTALSALAAPCGAWGLTCGVEWFAEEKIDVHGRSDLRWGEEPNLIETIARLNALLSCHPAFHAGAKVRIIPTGDDAPCICLLRNAAEGDAPLLILINLDTDGAVEVEWRAALTPDFEVTPSWDLLTGGEITLERGRSHCRLRLSAGAAVVLSPSRGDLAPIEATLARPYCEAPRAVEQRRRALGAEISSAGDAIGSRAPRDRDGYRQLVHWQWPRDLRREVLLPSGHALAISAPHPFLAQWHNADGITADRRRSVPAEGLQHVAALRLPAHLRGKIELQITVFGAERGRQRGATVHALPPYSELGAVSLRASRDACAHDHRFALCTNGRGATAQVRAAFGEVRSQYDCLLGANLNPDFPVDRQVLFTRCRAWISYRGRSHEIDLDSLIAFTAQPDGSRASWRFDVPLGGELSVRLRADLALRAGANAMTLRFTRAGDDSGPPRITLILRPDVEDRLCHAKTTEWDARAEPTGDGGFRFPSGGGHQIEVATREGSYVEEPEWHHGVRHPIDAERGFGDRSDLFSPGYFEIALGRDRSATLDAHVVGEGASDVGNGMPQNDGEVTGSSLPDTAKAALDAFVVQRADSLSVIAGYPWFLDWGRDTLIFLRGVIAAGRLREAEQILRTFARFEERGTLPNMIRGGDASDRDTSDAPLWFLVACADLQGADRPLAEHFLDSEIGGRQMSEILVSIVSSYADGTPNGIRMDPESGLIYSPPHFTWMDTNYPPGTPRGGYPIEIQAMWHAALRFVAKLEPEGGWCELADRVQRSIAELFPVGGDDGYLSDCLHAEPGQSAAGSLPDDHLRPNQLFAVTLGAIDDAPLKRMVVAACQELVVPGAIRSLADRQVSYALPYEIGGRVLNDPQRPYYGHYTADEETHRKPAYHNGTAWAWQFPSYAEALYLAHGEAARGAALSLLTSSARLFEEGCLGQLPEVLDGDAPHAQKGCGAQAWSASEFVRVLALLGG